MFTRMIPLSIAAALTLMPIAPAFAQTPEVPAERAVKKLPRQTLSGPRFGFTTFTGETADLRNSIGKEAIMSQFGWQFETQILSMESGNQALMEWVLLFGGLAQSELSVSLGWLAGYRLETGLEFGVGPNISITKDNTDPTTSMVVAVGATMPFGDMYVPVNVAMAFAEGGPRVTTLLGWIVG